MNQCRDCREFKSSDCFYKNYKRKDGLTSRCKICFLKNKSKYSRNHKYDRYGITNDQYNEMFLSQNGTCFICNQPETLKDKRGIRSLAVDHDHSNGKVRGLLCSKCNRGIGCFNDNPELMIKASQYIARHVNKVSK